MSTTSNSGRARGRKLPVYRPETVVALPQYTYGELVVAVEHTAGVETAAAEAIVCAVLGPLKLIPPLPDTYTACGHLLFSYEGEWHACIREHLPEDADIAEYHRASDGTEWRDRREESNDRAIHPEDVFPLARHTEGERW